MKKSCHPLKTGCIGFFCVHFARHRFGTAFGSGFFEWHRKAPDLASGEQLQASAQIFLALRHLCVVHLESEARRWFRRLLLCRSNTDCR